MWSKSGVDTSEGIVIDVKSFGAKGDGVTNDTQAIQNAINSLSSGAVYFPPGTYMVSGIFMKSMVYLFGNGRKASIIKAISPIESVISTVGGASDCSFTSIKDLTIDADNKAQYGLKLIYFTNGSTVKDCDIQRATTANVYLEKCWYANLDNVVSDHGVVGFLLNGLTTSEEVNGLTFVKCYSKAHSKHAVHIKGYGKSNKFLGCTFENTELEGVLIEDFQSSSSFDNCYFENCGYSLAEKVQMRVETDTYEGATEVTNTLFNNASGVVGVDYVQGFSLNMSSCSFLWNGFGEIPKHHVRSNALYTHIQPCMINGESEEDFKIVDTTKKFYIAQHPRQTGISSSEIFKSISYKGYNASADVGFEFGTAADSHVDAGRPWRYDFKVKGDAWNQVGVLQAMLSGNVTPDDLVELHGVSGVTMKKQLTANENIVFMKNANFSKSTSYNTPPTSTAHWGATNSTAVDTNKAYRFIVKTGKENIGGNSYFYGIEVNRRDTTTYTPFKVFGEGVDMVVRNGISNLRPTSPVIGHFYYDTTLGKPIWYNGTSWTDSTGAVV